MTDNVDENTIHRGPPATAFQMEEFQDDDDLVDFSVRSRTSFTPRYHDDDEEDGDYFGINDHNGATRNVTGTSSAATTTTRTTHEQRIDELRTISSQLGDMAPYEDEDPEVLMEARKVAMRLLNFPAKGKPDEPMGDQSSKSHGDQEGASSYWEAEQERQGAHFYDPDQESIYPHHQGRNKPIRQRSGKIQRLSKLVPTKLPRVSDSKIKWNTAPGHRFLTTCQARMGESYVRNRTRCRLCLGILGVLVVIVAVVSSVSNSRESASRPSFATEAPVLASYWNSGPQWAIVLEHVPELSQEALNDKSTPQYHAAKWMATDPHLQEYLNQPPIFEQGQDGGSFLQNNPNWRFDQRFALATLYYALHGQDWDCLNDGCWNPDWMNHTIHECEWLKGMCFTHGEYISLAIHYVTGLKGGSVPPEISLMTKLEKLEIANTDIGAHLDAMIPWEMEYMANLHTIDYTNSKLTGTIPIERLQRMQHLQHLSLPENFLDLQGKTAVELLLELPNLKTLTIGNTFHDPNVDINVSPVVNTAPDGGATYTAPNGGATNWVTPDPWALVMDHVPLMSKGALKDADSPQHKAAKWMAADPNLKEYLGQPPIHEQGKNGGDFVQNNTNWRFEQRFALATLYYSLHGEHWNCQNSGCWNANWINHTIHECEWLKGMCFTHGEYLSLTIDSVTGLKGGAVPPEISLLAKLEKLEITNTDVGAHLYDMIPWEMQYMFHLQSIDYSNSKLTGSIPMEKLQRLTHLLHLSLNGNFLNLEGKSTADFLSELSHLKTLMLGDTGIAISAPIGVNGAGNQSVHSSTARPMASNSSPPGHTSTAAPGATSSSSSNTASSVMGLPPGSGHQVSFNGGSASFNNATSSTTSTPSTGGSATSGSGQQVTQNNVTIGSNAATTSTATGNSPGGV